MWGPGTAPPSSSTARSISCTWSTSTRRPELLPWWYKNDSLPGTFWNREPGRHKQLSKGFLKKVKSSGHAAPTFVIRASLWPCNFVCVIRAKAGGAFFHMFEYCFDMFYFLNIDVVVWKNVTSILFQFIEQKRINMNKHIHIGNIELNIFK